MSWRVAGVPGVPLKSLITDSLAQKLTCLELQCRGSSLKSDRDIWGETKLTNSRVRAGGTGVRATLFRDRSGGRHQYSFVEFPSHSAYVDTKSVLSSNLANTICPALVIPSGLSQPNLLAQPKPLPVAPPHKWSASAHVVEFHHISQRSTNTKRAPASLGMPCTSW